MRKCKFAVLALVFLLSSSTLCAQDGSEAVASPDAKVMAIQDMVQNLERGLAELQTLAAQIDGAPAIDQGALVFRRDERSFELLKALDEVARRTAKLQADDPVRVAVELQLREDFSGLGAKLFSRIDQVVERIGKQSDALESLSGSRLIAAQAYLQALRTLRLDYYAALVNLIEGRTALDMDSADLLQSLSTQLYLHAETLVGKIEFSGQALDTLDPRLKADPLNAELIDASNHFKTIHRQDLEQLESIVALMGRVELDASVYKSAMLHQGQKISIRDIESDVVLSLLNEAWDTVSQVLQTKLPDLLFDVLVFVLIILAARLLARLVRRGVRATCERPGVDVSNLLKDVLVSVSGGIVIAIGFLMALSQLGISLAPMLAGLGVAGFIVGFALQDTLGNFASGAMILLYRPYDVDDFVEVVGASGLVKKMSLVSTTITTFDNQTLVIPNSKIWGDVIKNVTAQRVRRVDMVFGVGYDADIERVERVIEDIVTGHELVLSKPEPMIKLHELGDSSINFVVRPWTRTEDYWGVYWDITREVKLRFDREGISIPFPQRDVHLYQQPV